jgi:hypothetical protein
MQNPLNKEQKNHQAGGGMLRRLFAIDSRSLAAFRICLGVVLLVDIMIRGADIQFFYSDLGVLPREALPRLFLLSDWHWSVHLLTGSVAGQTVLFVFAALCALAMILGYRTRLAVLFSWILLASLHARNPMLQYGGDHLLRLLLFWSVFLPLGSHWSFDRLRGVVDQGGPRSHLSAASAAILIQMFWLYFISSLFKRNEVWQSGEGMSLALSSDLFSRPLAQQLLEYPQLMEVSSLIFPWLQLLIPLLLFIPWATAWFRALGILLLIGFHVAIELFLATGLFQYVGLSGLILFLPASFWDRLATAARPDGRLRTLAGAARERLRILFRSDSRPGPKLPVKWVHGLVQSLAFGLLIYALAWNVATFTVNDYAREHSKSWMSEGPEGRYVPRLMALDYAVEQMFGGLGWIGRITKLHQHWAMFQNGGGTVRGWHVIVGTLSDGREISLLEEGAPIEDGGLQKPDSVMALYPNVRWRIYFRYLRFAGLARDFLPAALSRDWNRRHPELRIERLRISFILDEAPGADTPEFREFLWYDGPVSDH